MQKQKFFEGQCRTVKKTGLLLRRSLAYFTDEEIVARKGPDFTCSHLISDPTVLLLNHAALGFKYSKLVIAMLTP